MTYEELIEETGAEIGIEGFTPDEEGVCILASDIGEIVIMDIKEPRETVLLNAAVCDVPPDASTVLMEALKVNRGFRDTKGASALSFRSTPPLKTLTRTGSWRWWRISPPRLRQCGES